MSQQPLFSFPGKLAEAPKVPTVSTFKVLISNPRTSDSVHFIKADQVWGGEGLVWFAEGAELTGVFSASHFKSATI
ncbi:hypothetical protein [Glutamicibacter arilaitensis]|uniref:hypothetical protein n=1 Tax=Glutamicibacter arilaitensis TaxID=256701 RepID=UPI003F8FAA74